MVKLAVITSTRAEYGLLHPLLQELIKEPLIELQLLVSGTHLLDKYGYTIRYIREDGIPIAEEIPILEEDFISNEVSVVDSIARAAKQSSVIFERERYDAVVVLGDRYELLGFCISATMCRIPIIHIHGGEITEGAIDDKIRHAITKLSSIHFPSIEEYAKRIIQMGENPNRVYAVGALGIDNIMHMQFIGREELLKELEIETELPIAAVTYHPVTVEEPKNAVEEIRQVLNALLAVGVFAIITMPNSDVGGDLVYQEILKYTVAHNDCMRLKKSLGQFLYLSLLKNADIMVGNSSSGILESASFGLPTINIGDRQNGRMSPKNVIHCDCLQREIESSIRKGLSKAFRLSLQGYINPYGDGKAAQRMLDIIKKTDFKDETLIRKKFYDIG